MTYGWFVFAVITAIVMVTGIALAAVLMRAAWVRRDREALSASDLRAVEESAMLLIEQLKSEADRSMTESRRSIDDLSALLARAESRIGELTSLLNRREAQSAPIVETRAEAVDADQVFALASRGLDCVDIAKATGADCADVKVALKLGALASS